MGKTSLTKLGLIVGLNLSFFAYIHAQSPDWSIDYSQFQFRMTASVVLERDGLPLSEGKNQVAVFVGDEIRGIGYANSYHEPTNRYLAIFQIGSNISQGDSLIFLIYDQASDEVLNARYTANFEADGLLGSINDPLVISQNQIPTEILLSTDFFTENSAMGEVVANLRALDGDDLAHTYTISTFDPPSASNLLRIENNEILINDVVNYEKIQRFSISVIASDPMGGSVNEDFIFQVIDQPEAPTSLMLSSQSIEENSFVPYPLAIISSDDEDQNETQEYSFTPIAENADSSYFSIDKNSLQLNVALDFEVTPSLQLYLTVTDKAGLTYSEPFTIRVKNEEEPDPVSNYLSPNGDGFNDFLRIENSELYRGFTLKVFTPQGQQVFAMLDYDNSWDGYYQGNPLPAGAYQYVFFNRTSGQKYDGLLFIKER